jgi:hypothetical protein
MLVLVSTLQIYNTRTRAHTATTIKKPRLALLRFASASYSKLIVALTMPEVNAEIMMLAMACDDFRSAFSRTNS